MNTEEQYKKVIEGCKTLFMKKYHDYGASWRVMRLPSVTDQIFIKASRIRQLQDKAEQLVDEPQEDEFVGIVNYCIIALMQIALKDAPISEPDAQKLEALYESEVKATMELLFRKNHDYGEAWRSMRVSSITDIILMKLMRTKQIEDLSGATWVSEGVEANYRDMMNYSVFCLIKLNYNNAGA